MNFFKDILFPKACLSCGFLGSHICPTCQKKLKKIEKDTCFYCKRPSFLGLTHPFCKKRYGVDGVLSCFYYDDVLKKIIKNIKYRLVREGLRELMLLIPTWQLDKLGRYNRLYENLILQPIPLFKTRKRRRGFNQAEEISRFLSMTFDFPKASNLVKIRNTFSQSQIAKTQERRRNIKGAFAVKQKNLYGEEAVFIVDDVMTSGATVAEAAAVLKRYGVGKVFIFTLAKG